MRSDAQMRRKFEILSTKCQSNFVVNIHILINELKENLHTRCMLSAFSILQEVAS